MRDEFRLRWWHNGKVIEVHRHGIVYRWHTYDSTAYRPTPPRLPVGGLRHSGWHFTYKGACRTAGRATNWTAPWERRHHRPPSRPSRDRSLR